MTWELTDDDGDACALCVAWVCAYCGLSYCADDECEGVIDQGALTPIHPDGTPAEHLYRGTHDGCQAAVDAYLEDCRRDPT